MPRFAEFVRRSFSRHQRYRACGRTGLFGRAALLLGVMATVTMPAFAGTTFPSTLLGSTSAPQLVTVTLPTGGTVASVEVLTQGVANLDFINAGGGSCTAATYGTNATCTVKVVFTPQTGGLLNGAVVLLDSSNVPLGTEYVQGAGIGLTAPPASAVSSQSVIPTSLINTFFGMAVDVAGNVYLTDYYGQQVLKETLANGTYTQSVIGSGFNAPTGIAVDGAGNVYIADQANVQIVKETPNGSGGYTQSVPITGLAAPQGLAVDGAGNLFIGDAVVLLETYSAGSYTQSTAFSDVNLAAGIFVDGAGDVYLSDSLNAQVVKETLSGGTFTPTVIGSGTLSSPEGITVDASGNVYVADVGLGQVVKETLSGGTYTPSTVGSGVSNPTGVALDQSGNLYIEDAGATQVYLLQFSAATNFGSLALQAPGTTATLLFTLPNGGALAATPYKVLTQGTESLDFNAAGTQSSTVCVTGHTYNAGDTCTVDVTFTPLYAGTRYGAVVLNGTLGSVVATGYMYGTGVAPQVAFTPANVTGISTAESIGAYGLAVDGAGNVYVGDDFSSHVLKIPAGCTGGCNTRSTIGTGLSFPQGVAVDGAGNVYIADSGHNRVVMVPAGCVNSCTTQTVVDSALSAPTAVAVDAAGNVYIADTSNGRIVKDTLTAGGYEQSVVDSSFSNPNGVAVDAAGNVYVADIGLSEAVEESFSNGGYTANIIASSVLADGVIVDGVGNVYVSTDDGYVLKETPVGGGAFSQITLASPQAGSLYQLTMDGAGNMYVSGTALADVLELGFGTTPSLTFDATLNGGTSADSPQTLLLFNNGNASLTFPPLISSQNPSISNNFTYGNSSTCGPVDPSGSPYVLVAGASCTALLGFSPTALGTITGQLAMTNNNLNVSAAQPSVQLNGVSTGTPTQLSFSTPPPPGVSQGYSAGVVVVQEDGASSSLAAGSDVITLTVTYPDTSQQVYMATAVSGVANFDLSAVSLTQTGTYTYVASASGLTPATANETVATPVATGILAFPITSAIAGQTNLLLAFAVDQFGNPFFSYSGLFTVTSGDPAAQITVYPQMGALYSGTASVTLNTVGTQTVTVSAPGLTSAVQNVTVTAAPGYTVTVLTDTTAGVAANCTDQTLPGATADASCSLRDAIAAANLTSGLLSSGSANIGFANALASQYPATIHLNGTELDAMSNLSITGPGSANLTIDAGHTSGIFELGPGFYFAPDVTNVFNLSGVTLADGDGTNTNEDAEIDGGQEFVSLSDVTARDSTNGSAAGFGPSPATQITVNNSTFSGNSTAGVAVSGGGLYITGGSVAINNTNFISNTADTEAGGGLYVDTGSTVTITGSTFTGNTGGAAGGLYTERGSTVSISTTVFSNNQATAANAEGGAALFESSGSHPSSVTVDQSSFSGNQSAFDGTIYIDKGGTLLLSNSTVTGNTATDDGGAIYSEKATVTVQQSTITANTAGNLGGAIYNDGGATTLVNATVTANSATATYGGIANNGSASPVGTIVLANSIVAGDTDSVNDPSSVDCYNCGTQDTHNLVGGAPQLSTLGNYGGPTQTMLPLPGSPAIAAGSTALAVDTLSHALTTDQRGSGFARVVSGNVDLGATESGDPTTVTATAGTPQSVATGAAFPVKFAATAKDPLGNVAAGATVTFTAPSTGASGTFAGGLLTAIATTNSSGVATAPLFTANTTTGGYTVTANIAPGATADFTLTNLQDTPVISWTPPNSSITYGATLATSLNPSASYNSSSVLGNYSYTAQLGSGTPFTVTGATVLPVGSYTLAVTFTPNDTVDYTTATQTTSLTVTPAPLTVTVNAATMPYGGPLPTLSGTLGGVVNSDNITVTYATNATVSSPVSGTYSVTATLHDPDSRLGNYSVTNTPAAFTITKTPLTVTANSATMPYGGPLPTLSGTLGGVISGDGITASYSTNATVSSPVSGTYSVTATLNDPSSKLGNYTVTNTPAAFTITKAPLTVTVNSATMPYGGPLPTLSGTLGGVISGDGITASYSTNATVSSPVSGTYSVTATLNDPSSKLANYTVTNTPAAFTITKAPLTVTVNAATMPYGGPLPTLSGTLGGVISGDGITASYSTNATVNSPVSGTYSVTATLNDPSSKLANYTVTNTPAAFTITKAPLTVTANAATMPYGGPLPTLSGTLGGVISGDGIAASYSTNAAVSSPVSGTYSVTATLNDPSSKLANYTVTNTPAAFTITKAPLTVTANAATMPYGGPLPTLSGTLGGVISGDGITASYSTNATVSSPVSGTYSVTATLNDPGSKLGNYTVTNTPAAFTITKAPLTVTANAATMPYGGPLPTLSGTLGGVISGDGITASYSTNATVSSPVSGTYSVTATLNDPGSKLGNYTVTNTPAAFTITKAPLTVTVNSATMPYGGPLPTLSGTLGGVISGDGITASYSTNATVSSPVSGTYSVTATLNDPGSKLGNYTVTNTPAAFTITKAPLTVTANAATMPYGGPLPTLSGTLGGVISGDGITASYSTNATVSSSVSGTYSVTATLNDPSSKLANYTVTNTPAAFTITKASQAITFPQPTTPVTYSGQVITLTATSNSTLGVSYSVVSGPGSVTGSQLTVNGGGSIVIAADQAGDGNYNAASEVQRTIVVNAAAQTVMFPAVSTDVTYGAVSPVTLAAAASSGLGVSYTVSGPATLSGSTLTYTGAGLVIVTATQTGSASYGAASASQVIDVEAAFSTSGLATNATGVAQTITFTATSDATVGALSVATDGGGANAFAITGGSCTTNPMLTAGQSCTVLVTYTANSPGLTTGELMVKDNGGSLIGTINLVALRYR